MSAYVLSQENIELLTIGTNAMLELNKRYPGSYSLSDETIKILGKYTGDLHNLYRALYITNIKAVNGRYREDVKTLPKYRTLHPVELPQMELYKIKKICGLFDCYLYQISEEPIADSPIFKVFSDIHKSICCYLVSKMYDWDGNAVN